MTARRRMTITTGSRINGHSALARSARTGRDEDEAEIHRVSSEPIWIADSQGGSRPRRMTGGADPPERCDRPDVEGQPRDQAKRAEELAYQGPSTFPWYRRVGGPIQSLVPESGWPHPIGWPHTIRPIQSLGTGEWVAPSNPQSATSELVRRSCGRSLPSTQTG